RYSDHQDLHSFPTRRSSDLQGIANQVSGSINSFVTNFQMASGPQIIKSYANDEKKNMTNLVIRTSKFSFYLLFILTLPVIIEIEDRKSTRLNSSHVKISYAV